MTDLYAVIGNPIAQSKSPEIHAAFARQLDQDLRYEAILAARDGFRASLDGYRAWLARDSESGNFGCNCSKAASS